MPKAKMSIHDDCYTFLLSRLDRRIKSHPDQSVFKFLKWVINSTPIRRNEDKYEAEIKLPSYMQSEALGIAALDDNQHCITKVTHDLSSFYCWDLEGLLNNLSKKAKKMK